MPRPAPPPAGPATLRRDAGRVLAANWTGSSTVPSRGLYPHQWSWDSAFVAIGLRHLSPSRARRELTTLFAAQWGDGRVPHIVFNPSVDPAAYFPGPGFWRSSRAGAAVGAPAAAETSGLVQPPVHALAAWLVHESDPAGSARESFLRRLHPRLDAWHRYLLDRRDLRGHGLVSIVHPWESGMDNSPSWDGPLERVEPARRSAFRRADLDHCAVADRPTDLDYGRYVRLAADYRDHGYRDDAPHAFAVEDTGFNALLALSEHALARIAEAVGAPPEPHRARAERLTCSLTEHGWDPAAGLFRGYDVRGGRPVGGYSAAGLLPLALPGLPDEIAGALLATLCGPHFGLGGAVRLVPSYDLRGPSFDPHRYWRGPAWFNVNWLLERGLRRYGAPARADALRSALLSAADASGFAEYVDPYTGLARGSRDFGWTAALALDLLVAAERDAAAGLEPGPAHTGRATAATGNGTQTATRPAREPTPVPVPPARHPGPAPHREP
nr:hypothetical protein [Streptomyces zingiberis]